MAYQPALDGVRALAILAVLLFHAKVPGVPGGFVGVDVFFVLSGFLITTILAGEHRRCGTIDLAGFYRRRLRRLYPALIVFLCAYLLTAGLLFPRVAPEKHGRDALLALFYLADYARALDMPLSVLNHTWSLAVEAQFYLLWPLLFVLLARRSRRTAILAAAGLFVALTGWRWWGYASFADPWDVYYRADTHATGLVLGCLLGLVGQRLHGRWAILGLLLLALAASQLDWRAPATAVVGFTLAEAGAALVVLSPPAWLAAAPLAWVGRMSYGLYLWHYPVMRLLRDQDWHWSAILLVGSAAGLAAAALSYYAVERPLLSRKPAGRSLALEAD